MSIISSELLLGAAEAGGGYQIERSLRFDPASSSYIDRTPSSAGNRKTWTWSGWVKVCNAANSFSAVLFYVRDGASTGIADFIACSLQSAFVGNSAQLLIGDGAVNFLRSSQYFRDVSAWYHLVISCDTTQATAANRLRFYVNGEEVTAFDTDSRSSLALNTDTVVNRSGVQHRIGYHLSAFSNMYLADFNFIDGLALDPSNFGEFDDNGIWQPIAYTGAYGTNGCHLDFADNSTAAALGTDTSGNGNDWTVNNLVATNTEYSPYYSLSPGGSFYGVNQSTYAARNLFDGSITSPVLLAASTTITYSFPVGIAFSSSFEIYYTHEGAGQTVTVNGVSQSLNNNYPTREWLNVTGITSPVTSISWTGIGASGPYMYAVRVDGVNIIVDGGPNCDSLLDSPTRGTQADTGAGGEVSGNYATWNEYWRGTNIQLSNGNLNVYKNVTSGKTVVSTIAVSSGKWYSEFTMNGTTLGIIGVHSTDTVIPSLLYPGGSLGTCGVGISGTTVYTRNCSSSGTPSHSAGAIVGVALDLDSYICYFYVNGVLKVTATGLAATSYYYAIRPNDDNSSSTLDFANFGQRPFAYTAPSGYKALCSTNLPDPTIEKGSDYFDVSLYTGNLSTQTISGLAFSPDLVWIKSRSNARNHGWWDTQRGIYKYLISNLTNGEASLTSSLTAFNSDGFDLGDGVTWNELSQAYVAWSWDAGSSSVTNNNGSITSSVRANPSAGFSIVTYTGTGANATVGHGLGVAPSWIIVKRRDSTGNWIVYTNTTGATQYLNLHSTTAATTSSTIWNNTAPTSTVINLGINPAVNASAGTHVAYCFSEVENYSAFGSYLGNGSIDGPFVYTGFRPAFVLYKCSSTTSDWWIDDKSRQGYNFNNNNLYPNLTATESSGSFIDILSNGFKLRTTDASRNGSGASYVYAAFAENPFKFVRAR